MQVSASTGECECMHVQASSGECMRVQAGECNVSASAGECTLLYECT